MLGRDFSEKKLAQLVISVRSTFQNDLHPPIGVPTLCYISQPRQQRNIAQQCANTKAAEHYNIEESMISVGVPKNTNFQQKYSEEVITITNLQISN